MKLKFMLMFIFLLLLFQNFRIWVIKSLLISQSGFCQPSIVSLRIGNVKPKIVAKILQQVLPQIETELVAGAIVSIEETRFRIRKLPITL